ncbi:MFS transporter [Pseudonocardia sp. NPDC049154]|uniref:MFS transporter n=1 Tax=Pseudonocardia sp. NPDC049154 TaxID=3155501 RepID=UPI0033E191A1
MSDVSPEPRQAKAGRVAAATFLGTTIEWYDFFIYGAAAAIVFGPQFFTDLSPAAALIASFGTFASGFVARPVGGILFGHFGDRFGRKPTLVASLLIMGLGTFCIALLPTYAQIGAAAPVLLILLRLVQGLGVGGEWGGAVLMATEHAPEGRRASFSSFPQMGIPAGIVLSNLVFLLTSLVVGPASFVAWGWRIPFVLSAMLVVVALFVRLRLEESPVFEAARRDGAVRRLPVLEVLTTNPLSIVLGAGVSLAPSALGYLFSVYLLSYGTGVGIPQKTMLLLISAAALVFLAAVVVSARISDRMSPTRVFLAGTGASVVVVFVAFALFDTATVAGVFGALAVLAVVLGPMVGVQAIIVTTAFSPSMRYTGASLAFQLGSVVGGGITPVVATTILATTGSSTAIAGYLSVVSILSLVSVALLPRTARRTGTVVTAAEPSAP